MSKLSLRGWLWAGGLFLLLLFAIAKPEPIPAAESGAAEATAEKDNGPLLESARIANSTAKPAPLRILVIGAHPADIFDQSGGTMAHHVKRGDWVGCVVVTTGIRTHDKVVANELHDRKELPATEELKKTMAARVSVKEKEAIHACSILGVKEQDVFFLGADDMFLQVNEPLVRKLASLIRKLRPDVIITHYPNEDLALGTAHPVTGQIAVQALTLSGVVDPEDKTPPHKVTQVFFFGQGSSGPRAGLWSAQGGFYNDVFIDITDVADKKVACLDAMESQGYNGAYARKRIETTDGSFGVKVGVPYAESFISLYSSTDYYLPVSQIDLQHAKGSDGDSIRRKSFRVSVP